MNPICLLEGNTLVTRLSMAEADPGDWTGRQVSSAPVDRTRQTEGIGQASRSPLPASNR